MMVEPLRSRAEAFFVRQATLTCTNTKRKNEEMPQIAK